MPAVNYEALTLFGKFGGIILGLLLAVWLIAVLTPKAAKLIDRLLGKPRQAEPAPLSPPPSGDSTPDNKAPPQGEPPNGGGKNIVTSENYKVYSIFEDRPLQRQEDKKQ